MPDNRIAGAAGDSGEDALAGAARSLQSHLEEALFVGVGLGLLAVQRAQVRRRELLRHLGPRFGDARTVIAGATGHVERRVKALEERLDDLDERVEAVLDRFETRLPEPARGVAAQARRAARDARTQIRDLARRRSPAA